MTNEMNYIRILMSSNNTDNNYNKSTQVSNNATTHQFL